MDLRTLTPHQILVYALLVGLVVRAVAAVFFTYPTDVNYWALISSNSTSGLGLYDLPGYYYHPVWGYILSMLTGLANLLGFSLGHFDESLIGSGAIKDCYTVIPSMGYVLILKGFLIIVDVMVAYYVYTIGRDLTGDDRKAAIMSAIWFLCPLTILISSVRVMFENLEILFLLMSISYIIRERYTHAGVAMGLSLFTKPFGAFAALLFLGYIFSKNRNLLDVYRYFSGLILTSLIIMLPVIVQGHFVDSFAWLVDRVGESSEGTGSIFNITLYLVPFLAVLTAVSTAIIAIRRDVDVRVPLLLSMFMPSMMLMVSGNVQYYLLLVPFLALLWSKGAEFPLAATAVLSLFAMLAFFDWTVLAYTETGLPGSWVLGVIGDMLNGVHAPLDSIYEMVKAVTGVLFSAFAVLWIHNNRRLFFETQS